MTRHIATLHHSAPLVLIGLSFASGIWQSSAFHLALALTAGVAVASIALAFLLRRDALGCWAALCIAAFSTGATRWAMDDLILRSQSTTPYQGKNVTLQGIVIGEPDERVNDVRLRVQVTRLIADSDDVTPPDGFSDTVLLRADKAITWRYGDELRALGRLDAPPRMPNFDYREYLSQQNVLSWMAQPERVWQTGENKANAIWSAIYAFKMRVRRAVQAILPNPESALLNGILIGDDNEIPPRIQDAFRATGTSHIVAISGFNVSLVINVLVLALARALNPRGVALVALPAIWLYALFVGASASVLRASLMASIGLMGQLLWRKGRSINTLAGAGWLMLLQDPNALFDRGFQLSVAATAGLILYADTLMQPANQWLDERVKVPTLRKLCGTLADAVLMSIAAQITTLPLLLINFGALSTIMLLANALVLPYQPAVMLLGALAAGAGLISSAASMIIALPAYLLLTLTLRTVEGLATWPMASLQLPGIGLPFAIAWYTGLIALSLTNFDGLRQNPARKTMRKFLQGALAALLLMALGLGALWFYQRPDGRTHLVFAGDGALVIMPDGKQLIFGNAADVLNSEGRRLPFWDREIEWLVMGERGERPRARALRLLQSYRIGTLLQPNLSRAAIDESSRALDEWNAIAQTQVARTLTLEGPQELLQQDHLRITLLPLAANRHGLRITLGSQSLLLLGEGDLPIATSPLADVVFANVRSHNVQQTLQRESPRWVVWQDSGATQSYTLNSRTRWLSLRELGRVEFVSDGRSLILLQ